MVIQRWQTLMLILAVCLMAAFCTSSYGLQYSASDPMSSTPLLVSQSPIYLVANLIIAIILFVTVFLYKNLKLQMKMTILSAVLICLSGVFCGWMVYGGHPDSTVRLTGGIFLLMGAFICSLMAYNFMRKDHKLLTSYDRLR